MIKNYRNFRIHATKNFYHVQGQKSSDLNWETLFTFGEREKAVHCAEYTAHRVSTTATKEITVYNEAGYGIVTYMKGEETFRR